MAHGMNQYIKQILVFLMTALLLAMSHGCRPTDPPTHHELVIGGETWVLELAVSPEAIEQGLMFRENIPEGTGMLFLFDRSEIHQFWMGNCLTDIDIIFLDGAGHITAAHEMTAEPPRRPDETDFAYRDRMPSYPSRFPVRAAVEFPPGTIRRLGLKANQSSGLDMKALETLRREASRQSR
ncbi:MAG: DUF192 domain-containing protein [Phycisphaerales bacterium]|nr:DUF192 domain-containing protein [Phycisphaerales bacterium]